MEHFLLQLAKTSAIGGAVIALLLALRPFLGKRYRARMYYWLWLFLAVLLLLPIDYSVKSAPVQIEAPSEHVMVWADTQAVMPKVVHKEVFVPEDVTPALSSVPPGTNLRTAFQPARRMIEVSAALFLAWLAGVAIFLTVQGVGCVKFRRLTRRWSEPLRNDRYGEILHEEASALGLTAPKVALCPAVSTPALTGLIRPKLLLPHEDYTEIELRFILRHELTHLKHRDILYKLILIFANALHWFNPLVYLMLRAADEDIELSCDSAVTRNMEKAERAAYSETLLKAVRSKGDTVVLTSCFGSTVERLKRRITNILDGRKKRRGVGVAAFILIAAVALGAAIGFAPAKSAPKTHGAYADVEDYLMHKMPSIGSEVSYYPYSEDGTVLEEIAAKVLDRKLAWFEQTGTVSGLASEGTLQSWTYSYLLKLDAPTNGVRLVGGMYEQDGYYDLEGQGGHNLVVLQYADGSIDVLYDAYVNDNLDFYGYHNSYEETIYDWYVTHCNLDRTEYPLYVLDWRDVLPDDAPMGNYPVHRYDGDGWYIYIPVSAWVSGVGEPIWYSSYYTESTIVVKTFDTPLSEAQDYFEREGWTKETSGIYLRDQDGQHAAIYLLDRPAGGHYEVQTFWYDQSDGVNEWGWSAKTQVETEQKILACMAKSFTVDERFAQTQAFSDALSAFSAEADAAEAIAYCPSGFSSTLGGLVTDSDLLRELKAALASIQPVSLTLSEEDARKIPLHSAGFILYDTVPEDSSPFQKPDYFLWNSYIVAAKDMSVVGQLNSDHRSTFHSAWNRQSHRNADRSDDSEASTPKPTAESIKASAVSSVDYGGFLWFVADGYFSRYADTGSVEQLYKLPLGYDDETPVFASISVIAAKIALSYHVGGAIMGYDELRLFDNQTGAQTHEISGYGSFAINGDTIVKTTGFMPPAAGNLRISRDCGKTWEPLGDPKYLYDMIVSADGDTVRYIGDPGSLSLHDGYLYVTGIDTSLWDGSSAQIPETHSLRIDLNTGETKVGID
ncbi:MAG: M56 family metallopeptidase [Eubacteriales bacterium]|nr:M56 family metallopeptidase [Eubacteriales bacterium]